MNEWVRKEVCCGVETTCNGFQVMMMAGEGTRRGGTCLPQTFLLPGNIVFLRQGFNMILKLVLNLASSFPPLSCLCVCLNPR